MPKTEFDRQALVKALLSKERVIICPYAEADEPLSGPHAPIQLYIGAFCFVELSFAKVAGLPEMAHAQVGPLGFEYVAGEDAEEDMADELHSHASRMLYFNALGKGGQITSRSQRRRGQVCSSPGKSSRLTPPKDGENLLSASKLFFDKVEYLGSEPANEQRKTAYAWYRDISWDEHENEHKRLVRNGYTAFLSALPELMPQAEVTGCREDEVTFEYKGLCGTFGLDYDAKSEIEAWLSVEPFSSGWYGNVEADIAARYPAEGFPANMLDDLYACMPGFNASISSFAESPVVMLRKHVKSNYTQESIPFSGRELYPASTPKEMRRAIGTGADKPAELARVLLDGKLEGYRQCDYDAQHDVSRTAYDFEYDEEANRLRFFYDIDECVNIERLPSFCETEEYIFDNVTRKRLEMLASTDDPEYEPDPNFIEWTVKLTEHEDGSATYEVGEFPDIAFSAENAGKAYEGMYELINAEITRRLDAGEKIPSPMTWQEAEKYLGRG